MRFKTPSATEMNNRHQWHKMRGYETSQNKRGWFYNYDTCEWFRKTTPKATPPITPPVGGWKVALGLAVVAGVALLWKKWREPVVDNTEWKCDFAGWRKKPKE
jgi:hypothetical protein